MPLHTRPSQITYGPSDPTSHPPSYPLTHLDKIIIIETHPCMVRLDHYRVIYSKRPISVSTLVQDENWEGPLAVLRWVAGNDTDMVAECEGKDMNGRRIVRFLVIPEMHVTRPEDVIGWEQWGYVFRRYTQALGSERFSLRGRFEDELPIPGPFFDV